MTSYNRSFKKTLYCYSMPAKKEKPNYLFNKKTGRLISTRFDLIKLNVCIYFAAAKRSATALQLITLKNAAI